MPKIQIDYSNTIIYKICCKETNINDIYIGHTTNFIQRKNQHKKLCNNNNYSSRYVYKFIRQNGGWDNWSMIQIENRNCKNKREAESIEQYWIEKLLPTLNVNKPYAMCKEEPQLYKQNWYEENKQKILEKAKKNYEENKEEKLEYQKEYVEKHKDQIYKYQKEYQKENKEKISEQKKIYREANKETAKIQQKQWREENKEKLKAERSQIIDCECGNSHTFGNKHRHLQSKVHINYQNKLCGIIEIKSKISDEEKNKILYQKRKEYREKNAEKIKEYKKKYNEKNKEQNKEQRHIYYENHKEELKLKAKQYVEENKDKVKEKMHEWYQKNKEKILEKQKEMINCECGSEICKSGKREHYNSKKHQDYLQSVIEK
jgi:hypothetical protein